MKRVVAVDVWANINGTNVPSLFDKYCSSFRTSDITGQPDVPTNPNVTVWEFFIDDATYQAILDDADYGYGSILTVEDV